MDYQFIKVEVTGEIALVEMDRKHELNALSYGMLSEINHAFSSFLRKKARSGS
jgi:enoyl-CoA hydratase/carnithine racemase